MITSARQKEILLLITEHPGLSISALKKQMLSKVSVPTLNRDIAALVKTGWLLKHGKGRSINYVVSPVYLLTAPIDAETYFSIETDQRKGFKNFQEGIFSFIAQTPLFTQEETTQLQQLHARYLKKTKQLSPVLMQKEFERLTIELSWKSSQIEGNTYSLLETEALLKENIPAKNKKPEEAVMIINHKTAMDYLFSGRITTVPLKISTLENIHSLLTNKLGVTRNLRRRPVGVTGTFYTPPDNEFQIREYLEKSLTLINKKKSDFEKALLAVLFVSYIQPFEDGNKRTARIISNGILMEKGYCPLSYRSIDPVQYKKAMILFYEQNNIYLYKKLFMEQYEFAVTNYF